MLFLYLAAKSLRKGGKVILRYPNGDSPFVGLNLFNDITHVWTYTSNALRALGNMHGFTDVYFQDEGINAIRDKTWLKKPIALFAMKLTQLWLRMILRQEVPAMWNPNMWACLCKQ